MKIKNPFTEKWLDFQSNLSTEKLAQEFQPKPFIERAKGMYYAAMSGTYMGNLVSAVSELALVLYVVSLIVPWAWLSIATSLLIVGTIEWFKRSIANHIWHDILVEGQKPIGFIVAATGLALISIAGSVVGANWAIRTISEDGIQKVSYASQVDELTQEIKRLDSQIQKLSTNRNAKGRIYDRTQKAINNLTKQRAELIRQRADWQERERLENSALYVKSMNDIDRRAYSAIWIVLLFELIFHISYRFTKIFRFRSAVEMGLIQGVIGGTSKGFGSSNGAMKGGSLGGGYGGSQQKKSPILP